MLDALRKGQRSAQTFLRQGKLGAQRGKGGVRLPLSQLSKLRQRVFQLLHTGLGLFHFPAELADPPLGLRPLRGQAINGSGDGGQCPLLRSGVRPDLLPLFSHGVQFRG